MKQIGLFFLSVLILLDWVGCRQKAQSEKSFDQICDLVSGRTAREVEEILGPPDTRQKLLGDERWVWWDYTYLEGMHYTPDTRGRIVHLEITFHDPSPPEGPRLPAEQWRVSGPLAVSYALPRLAGVKETKEHL